MGWFSTILFLLAAQHVTAQYDNLYTIASSWSMWSAWSACAPEGVMIRVRACSTVRGFKCVGRNKEFKSCELGPPSTTDFDHVDDDRQMALRQLYQDYDLTAEAAQVPRKPSPRPPLMTYKPKPPMRPGNEDFVVAPPGSRVAPVKDTPDGDTRFRGDWQPSSPSSSEFSIASEERSSEEVTSVATTKLTTPTTTTTTTTTQRPNSVEQVLEEDSEVTPPPTRVLPQKRKYKASYVKQVPTTTTTPTPTTAVPLVSASEEEEDEVVKVEEQMPMITPPQTATARVVSASVEEDDEVVKVEQQQPKVAKVSGEIKEESAEEEPLPSVVDPVLQKTTIEVPTLSSSTEAVTTTEATTTTTITTTEATTTEETTSETTTERPTSEEPTTTKITLPSETLTLATTPASFAISPDNGEVPIPVKPRKMGLAHSKRLKKLNNQVRQPLPNVLGMPQTMQPTRFSFLPPVAPPRLSGQLHHSGEVDAASVGVPKTLLEKKNRLRRLKNRRRKITTPAPAEDVLTGDTARALTWLIANMTSSTDGEASPVMDTLQLERDLRKEAKESHVPVSPELRWSQWSLWSECSCGIQKRKRICLPSSRETTKDTITCPPPQYQERKCYSDVCH